MSLTTWSISLPPSLVVVSAVILAIELLSLLLCAVGGQTLHRLLQKGHHVRFLNRIAGTAMIFVAVWRGAF